MVKLINIQNSLNKLENIKSDIKARYQSNDNVTETKNFIACCDFYYHVLNNSSFNSKVTKIIKHDSKNFMNGMEALHQLHNKNINTWRLYQNYIVFNPLGDDIKDIAKNLNYLIATSGGGKDELNDTYYVTRYGDYKRATYFDVISIMNEIIDDLN